MKGHHRRQEKISNITAFCIYFTFKTENVSYIVSIFFLACFFSSFHYCFYPEAEFLDVIGTKVLRVFLIAIHSHLY